MNKAAFLIALLFLIALPSFGEEWRTHKPGDTVRIPEDFFFQADERVQWWYFTGHLYDQAGREFGYELSLFAAGVQKSGYTSKFGVRTIYLSHAAVTDVQGRQFLHQGRLDSGAYGFAGAERTRLRVWVDHDLLEGSLDRMHIKAGAGKASFDLVLVPRKQLVLNGDKGYSRKSAQSPENASLYFSFTDLETTGSLRINEREFQVSGRSWFDRELFSRGLVQNEAGWDWFALQLDDGREIMLYRLRNKDGTLDRSSSGTVVSRDGRSRPLGPADFTIIATGSYQSKHTAIRYPSAWLIEIPSEQVRVSVVPLLQDQEFLAPGITGNAYWEGACRIEGTSQGRAYVELTGY